MSDWLTYAHHVDMAVEEALSSPEWTSNEAIDANVRKVVRTLMAMHDMEPPALGDLLGIKRSAAFTRVSEGAGRTRFTAAEVYRLARLFDVPVDTFYTPPSKLIIGWYADAPGLTCEKTSIENPFQLPLDFAAVERRADLRVLVST